MTEDAIDELDFRRRRIAYRAWHRGTRESDMMVGGFADRYSAGWSVAELDWFETLLEENDVDIMAWGLGRQPAPEHLQGALMDAFLRLDFIGLSR